MIADGRGSQIADRKSQIADDRKGSCFHNITDDREQLQSPLLPTVRSGEVPKLQALCAGSKTASKQCGRH